MTTVPCPQIGTRTFAGRDTLLSPAMLVRRPARNQHWLSSNTNVTYHYLGRNASHALVRGLGLGNGAEVLFPSFAFVTTVNAYVIRGVKPIFADIRPDTLNLDEKQVEKHITKTYLRKVQAPVGVRPVLRAWMELC